MPPNPWRSNKKLRLATFNFFSPSSPLSTTNSSCTSPISSSDTCRLSWSSQCASYPPPSRLNTTAMFASTDRHSRNSTSYPYASKPASFDTYWGTFDEISNYNIGLNYFEKLWLAWYTYMQNDVLATGIMSFTMHEVVYFGRSLPWIIIDCIPWFRRYKIQNVYPSLNSRQELSSPLTSPSKKSLP